MSSRETHVSATVKKPHRVSSFLRRHSEFVSDVAIVMSGKALAAAIALFTMPIVARLFSPGDFGVAAMFVSITSFVAVIASLRYGTALVLPQKPEEALTLKSLAYRILLCFCAGSLVLLGIYHVTGTTWSAMELLGPWKWFLPLGILLLAAVQIQECWLTRLKSFKLMSAALVVGNTFTSGSRIAFGTLFGSSAHGLITGYLFGLASRLALQRVMSRELRRIEPTYISWKNLREVAARYADFPKLNTPAAVLFSAGQDLPVLLFGMIFSPVIAGLYAMADRLSQVPIAIVALSIRNVFLQKAATIAGKHGNLRTAFILTTGGLALLGAPPFLCLWLYGRPILTWVLGEDWSAAGDYLEIMAPWLFALWVAAPCHPIFIVLRRQQYWLLIQSVSTVLKLVVFAFAFLRSAGAIWTLEAFVAASILGNLLSILVALVLASRRTAN